MKAVIFGINGQDGFYLRELCDKKKIKCIGVSRSQGDWIVGDIGDFEFVKKTVKNEQPDFIFHLAANSTTIHSALFENHNTISIGTINILESVRLHSSTTKVFLSGSAMQFKNDQKPINERNSFEANSPYSISRISSVYTGRYYRNKYKIKVYIGYLFNHDSPFRTERHVNQKIVKAIRRIKMGSSEKIELGDINVKKEFNFAGDIINAIWTLVNQEVVYEVVIGSGKVYSIKDWLEHCFGLINRNWEDYVIIKEGYKPEYKILQSNPELMYKLGWKPMVDISQLAKLMMDF